MKRLWTIAAAAAFAFGLASVCRGSQTIEMSLGASGAAVEKTATSRDILLVLPERFFRPKGEAGFSTPYIAELHYTIDGGKTWKSYGFFKDLEKPFEFTAEAEGRYGFFVTFLDQKGNYDATPTEGTAPQMTVLVDWTAPVVALDAPAGGDVAGGTAPTQIKWKATDTYLTAKPITIEISTDGGKTWQEMARQIENSGMYPWAPAAGQNGRALIRVTAVDEVGHTTSAETASAILVDTTPPTATITGPTLSGSDATELSVKADDGDGSGVAQVELWTSDNNGASWTPGGKTAAGQPVVFKGTTGKHALFVTAADKAGNEGAAPKPGDAPQVTLEINTKTPIVHLKTLADGGNIAGGSRMPIQWEAVTPKPSERNVSIFISPDGGNIWSVVASDIENSGVFVWDAPQVNSSNCLLKVTVKDAGGVTGEAQSAKAFTIDSTRPTSAIGVPPAAMSQPLCDLSTVLRPMKGQGAGAEGAPAGEKAAGGAAAEEGTTAAEGAEGEAAPRAEGVTGAAQPTQPLSQPWTAPEAKPYDGTVAPGTSEEDVLKAAFAAYKAGQLPIAKQYFQQAAKLEPKDARPHAALGRIYAREAAFNYSKQQDAFGAALYEFDKALALGGDDADIYNDRGFVLLGTKRNQDAEKSFAKATQLGNKAIYWSNLAIAIMRQGRKDEAAAAFGKALVIEPEMKEANFYMGEIAAGQGKWADAKTYYTKAVDAYGPDDPLGKVALGGIQKARVALGEVEPEKVDNSTQQKLDRIR
jgi:Tfp pilus assembly protein PilF